MPLRSQYHPANNASVKHERNLLTQTLHSSKRIVFLTGAGISTSAGIPDLKDPNGPVRRNGGKSALSANVYKTNEGIKAFHSLITESYTVISAAKPTAFHKMIFRIALQDRLWRHYDQNFDGLSVQPPFLSDQVPMARSGEWEKLVQLHGSIHYMACDKCKHVFPMDITIMRGNVAPACWDCDIANEKRLQEPKARAASCVTGAIKPRILLYDHDPQDEEWDQDAITNVQRYDQRAKPTAFIVAGTRLTIKSTRDFAIAMCEAVRASGGITIWISLEEPPAEIMGWIDLKVKGTCDEFAALINL